jgi:hypothetical protein
VATTVHTAPESTKPPPEAEASHEERRRVLSACGQHSLYRQLCGRT